VAFVSNASNLVAGDTNGLYDVFVRDLTSTTTVRVSVDSDEVEGNNNPSDPSISADGGFVAFASAASNLVAGDTNSYRDVFVRDLTAGTTVRVSVDSDEEQANGRSYDPSISADGRYVAFHSDASNLVALDLNVRNDVFVRDLTSTTTVRVSVDSDEVEGDAGSSGPSISADGRFVAFDSYATNLVAGDTNGRDDVFVRDLTATTTIRVSVNNLGVQGNFGSTDPSISADGRYVGFISAATNLTTVTDPPANTCDASDGPTYADDRNCRFDLFLAGSPAELPPTGGNPAGVVLVAVVLLGAGTCVLGLRRARTA
jgi:Tol biopolymer transport system component